MQEKSNKETGNKPFVEGKFSERLGLLTRSQFQQALDRFDLGELLSVESAPGGLFGMCVFVTATSP